jgi:formylglycine-generating enzyme required for sulfatase activity
MVKAFLLATAALLAHCAAWTEALSFAQGCPAAYQNSLGVEFRRVGEVLFSTTLVRVEDFDRFARDTNLYGLAWRDPGFPQGRDHPVVKVTWQEAIDFCAWLTKREQQAGKLAGDAAYRLPTDLEWSRAAGLGAEAGATPEERDIGVPDVFPWGKAWPPPARVANICGEETRADVALKGYNDGFEFTSPVTAFPPNELGLHDMAGNVYQWCMDTWNRESASRVLRGSSWYSSFRLAMLASCRIPSKPDASVNHYGFRVVIGPANAGSK